MEFKLDNAEGQLVNLTKFSPDGYVSVPVDNLGLRGGGDFTVTFPSSEEVNRHLMGISNLNTDQSQTYEYKRGGTTITGECFMRELHFPSSGNVRARFAQTGPQEQRRSP